MPETMKAKTLRIVDLRHQQNGQIRLVDHLGDVANVLARHPDADAYARLFAAAPEMAELLRECAHDAGVIAESADSHPTLACAMRIRDNASALLHRIEGK